MQEDIFWAMGRGRFLKQNFSAKAMGPNVHWIRLYKIKDICSEKHNLDTLTDITEVKIEVTNERR